MSFKKRLIVLGTLFIFSTVATVLVLPWATPDLALSRFGLIVWHPAILVLLGGVVVVGLVDDRLQ